MKGKLFASLCGIWALGAADAIEIVSPTGGETVRQHFPAQVEYLTRPLVERECYFDGKENAQAMRRDGFRPRPAEIRWKDAAGPVRVTVKRLPDGKVFFAETVVGTNAVAVDSLEIARAWELTVADGRASASVRFRTEDLAPRLIRIEGVPNARDLGGWKGLDGRRIRQGVLFRTSGLNDNPPRRYLPGAEVMRLDAAGKLVTMDKDGRLLHQRILRGEDFASVASVRVGFLPEKARARLTDAERTRALKAYGFQIDVDLRRDAECFGMTGSPLGGEVRWHHVPYLPYDIDGEAARDCNRRVLRFLLDPANHPAVFHCIGGADRTGTVACLIEALLGVGEDDLWKDYLATGFWGEVSNRKHHDMFAHLLYQLRQRGGHSLAECARSYFLDLGFTAAEITAFRELMLEHLEKPNFGGTKHADWRTMLPRPIYDERPELVDFYYKAWEIAHTRIDEVPGIPAPRYMDEAHRSDRIWIWDTCFMVHFCKYCPEEFPGIESLENFYGVMLADSERPLPKVKGNRWCGADEGKMLDFRIHHPDNPPLFAWTEYAYALQTGDRGRLEKVYSEKRWLQRWYELFESFDPAAPQPFGSVKKVMAKMTVDGYRWGGCPSGMDNTPRGRTGTKDPGHPGLCPNNPDLLWVDAIAQQGLSALYLSRIADLLGRTDEAKAWLAKSTAAKDKVNALYWDETDGFYYDILESDRSKVKVMTPASFWAALAEMPTAERASRMFRTLEDDNLLGGSIPTVSLARNDPDFLSNGGYWRGSVWLPTTYMTVKSAGTYGETALARTLARKVVERMYRTYAGFEPHTIWECYSPTEDKPAITAKTGKFVRSDFCGWSALGPISLFIEDVIGIRQANAFENTLVCDFEKSPNGRVGVENYRFGKVVCSIVATGDEIRVESNLPFALQIDRKCHAVRPGRNVFGR